MAPVSSCWFAASGFALTLVAACRSASPADVTPPAADPPSGAKARATSFVQTRLGSGAFRVHGPLDGVAFTPDGQRIAAVSQTAGVYAFDRSTGQVQAHLPFEGDIADMALLPDGDTVLVSGRGGVHRYSLREAAQRAPLLAVETQTGAIDVDDNGERLIVTDGGAALRVVAVANGEVLASFGGEADYEDVAFVSDSPWVAASLSDRVGLWNWETGQREHQLLTSQIGRFTVGADGSWIAVVGYGRGPEVSVWSLDDGQRRHVLSVGSTGTLASSPDGRLLLVNEKTHVGVWDVQTGQRRHSLSPTSSYARTIVVSPDGTTVAAGGNDHTIGLWSLEDGSKQTSQPGHRGEVLELAFSADEQRLVSASYGDQRAIVWSIDEARELFHVPAPEGFGAAAFDPERGGVIVVEHGERNEESLVHTSGAGEAQQRWSARLSLVRDAHLMPDGQLALAEGGQITVLPLGASKPSWRSENLSDDPDPTTDGDAGFSPDGTTAVLYGGSRWMSVDLVARTVRQRGTVASCRFVDQAVIAADGAVVVGTESEFGAETSLVILWRNGVRERALPVEGSTDAIASDRVARRIAYATADDVGIWDPVGGRLWTVARTVPTALAMTPGGERLAVGFGNGTVEIWDVDALMRTVTPQDAPASGQPEPCPEQGGGTMGIGGFGIGGGGHAPEVYEGMFEPPTD